MGIIDAIKRRFGGGDAQPPTADNRMREPPGQGQQGRSPPAQGPRQGQQPVPRQGEGPGGPRFDEEPPRREEGGRPPRGPGRTDEGGPRGRDAPGGPGDLPAPGTDEAGDFDFETAEGPGRGGGGPEPPRGGQDDFGADLGPDPRDRDGPRMEPERRGRERGDRGGGVDDMPERPRDYNLDLPAEGGDMMEDRLLEIAEQNDRIIDLLEEIRDGMRRPRR